MRTEKPFGKILFKEEQAFRQAWLWLVLIISFAIPLVLMMVFMVSGKESAERQHGLLAGFFVVLASGIINLLLFYITRFETIVTDEGIFYRWRPFLKKYTIIEWPEVKEVIVKKYPYLQYGYHITLKYGRVHNVNGHRGVQFILLNDRKIFLGSQRIAAFKHALDRVMPQIVRSEINNID